MTERHRTLVVDASVVINLLGSGKPERVLRLLERRIVLVDLAENELKCDPVTGKPAAVALDALTTAGLLECVTLSEDAYGVFLELTGAPTPHDLGDGEAATIACAEEIGGAALIDERKAARIASARSSGIQVLNTLDLYASLSATRCLSEEELAELVFRSLQHARMRVSLEFRPWVEALIGPERAASCPSLGIATRATVRSTLIRSGRAG